MNIIKAFNKSNINTINSVKEEDKNNQWKIKKKVKIKIKIKNYM